MSRQQSGGQEKGGYTTAESERLRSVLDGSADPKKITRPEPSNGEQTSKPAAKSKISRVLGGE